MSDFAGQEYDFAAGSTKGLRSWNIDHLGRLHGVTHQEVWVPGENVSVCKQTTEIRCPNPVAPTDRLPKLSDDAVAAKPKRKGKRGRDLSPYITNDTVAFHLYHERSAPKCGEPTCHDGRHTVPSGHRFDPDCQCGFWAYDEGGFKPHGTVIGVIEGYGKTTVGTKGFRCEKARIVGLSMNDSEGKPLTRSVLARLATLYPDVVFAETLDTLIDAHPEVLRSWDAVDEGFWLRPVPEKEGGWLSWSNAAMKSAGSYTIPSSYFRLGGSI